MTPATIDWQRIGAAHPELSIRSVEALGEGWTSQSYLVNGSLVFRFPKRQEVWDELEREIDFLVIAADLLPLPVPRYASVVRESTAAAHGYAMYAYVPGRALTLLELSREERVAAAGGIATFLGVLHDLHPPELIGVRLPHDDERARAVDLRRLAEQAILPQLSKAQGRRLLDQSDWYIDTHANFSYRPVVIHADLSTDHILVDNRCVRGIIDFSDVSFGDADYDFTALFLDLGEEFTLDVAQRYGHSNPDLLLKKLQYFRGRRPHRHCRER